MSSDISEDNSPEEAPNSVHDVFPYLFDYAVVPLEQDKQARIQLPFPTNIQALMNLLSYEKTNDVCQKH